MPGLTIMPLPGWNQLRQALRPVEGASGTGPWRRQGDGALWTSGSAASLAMLAAIAARSLGRPPVVWLPAYMCGASLLPLRATGARLLFYPVTAQAQTAPDWRVIQALDVPCDLFVLVHWFGLVTDAAPARAFCDRHGALLVEDAAHAGGPAPGIGEAGDMVLYSPHKILPLPDGGVVVVRPRAADWESPLAEERDRMGAPQGAGWKWISVRAAQKTPLGWLRDRLRPGGQARFLSDPGGFSDQRPGCPSDLALRLAALCDVGDATTRRWRNACALADGLAGLAGTRAIAAPYRLVLECDTPERADDLYTRLRRRRLPVESWPDLPPEVQGNADMACWLRWTRLFLPVHQGLAPDPLRAAYQRALKGA